MVYTYKMVKNSRLEHNAELLIETYKNFELGSETVNQSERCGKSQARKAQSRLLNF